MNQAIDMARFRELLDTHGGTPSRWPPALREAARGLLEASAEARAALVLQQRIEIVLDSDVAPVAHAGLHSSILARAPRAPATGSHGLAELWAALGGLRIAGPAFAAALLLGISLGSTITPTDGERGEETDLVALAQLSDEYPEY